MQKILLQAAASMLMGQQMLLAGFFRNSRPIPQQPNQRKVRKLRRQANDLRN